MSLFQARERWSTQVGAGDEFDSGSMAVGNVDNDPEGQAKVVVGSLQGMLRVYHPKQADYRIEDLVLEQDLSAPILQLAIGHFMPAAPEVWAIAVLHPRKLGVYTVEPVGGRGAKASYFNLVKAYEHALGLHGAHFTAANMTHGPFGGVDRDLLAVQSMDGRLQVFEQDAHAFTRRLRRVLIPGPLCYVAGIDSFVTCNSEHCIDCYKYQLLVASSSGGEEDEGKGGGAGSNGSNGSSSGNSSSGSGGRSGGSASGGGSSSSSYAQGAQVDWSVKIGEAALDIFVSKFGRSMGVDRVDIVVLGERTLFTLKDQGGGIRLQKVIEASGGYPSCACKYVVDALDPELRGRTVRQGDLPDVGEENVIISTHSDQLMVFRDLQLVWAARVKRPLVALTVMEVDGIPGMLCGLDEKGTLDLLYLGTDPPSQAVVVSDAKEVDYGDIEAKHRQLLQVIKRSQSDSGGGGNERLSMRAQMPNFLDGPDDVIIPFETEGLAAIDPAGDGGGEGGLVQVTFRVFISYTGKRPISGLVLHLTLPPSVVVANGGSSEGGSGGSTSIPLPPLNGNGRRDSESSSSSSVSTPLVVPVVLHARAAVMASSLDVVASVVYKLESGEPRAVHCKARLPLCMACRLTPASKASDYKLTLHTNREPLSLLDLFEDMLSQPGMTDESVARVVGNTGSSVLSFAYFAQDEVTGAPLDAAILVSRNAGRYRVQSGSLSTLWLVTSELYRRLQAHFTNGEGSQERHSEPLVIEYQEPLPLQDFYATIDHHFQCRQELQRIGDALNDKAHQFRVVQKRLLSRFKDRNPAPLNALDVIMNDTYHALIDLGDAAQRAQHLLAQASSTLSCTAQLLCLLVKCRFQLGEEDHTLLLAHLHADVASCGPEQDWEETVNAAMTHLLRTSLAKTAKEATVSQAEVSMPPDTVKLQKHISIVLDRISKGSRLVLRQQQKQHKQHKV